MYNFLMSLTVFHLFLNSTSFALKMQIHYRHILRLLVILLKGIIDGHCPVLARNDFRSERSINVRSFQETREPHYEELK